MEIIFENDNILVLNKPAGMLVHPTQAGETDTLVSWLKERYPDIIKLNWPDKTRPGVVHRLDKDTSGLIIVAKNPEVLAKLQELFQSREVQKTYTALVYGKLDGDGIIDAPITRGDAGLQKVLDTTYSFSKENIRPAITGYRAIKHLRYHDNDITLVEAMPKTGRMHQIRVHLKHLGFPIIGDPLYNTKPSRAISKELDIERQFLHSSKLEFTHPIAGDVIKLESPLPEELKDIIVKISSIK
ncbi:MAG: RluA family pseudouridine synthase [Candidatus Berkelbacteria bacterium]|nr:RluA family pseudouridine synthase [Candidatus Berkelbacteria bacterium]